MCPCNHIPSENPRPTLGRGSAGPVLPMAVLAGLEAADPLRRGGTGGDQSPCLMAPGRF